MQRNIPILAALPIWVLPALGATAIAGAGVWGFLAGRRGLTEEERIAAEQAAAEQAQQQATTRSLAIQLWLEQKAPYLYGSAALMAVIAGYLYWRSQQDAEPAVRIVGED
jgi:hypothetical protein